MAGAGNVRTVTRDFEHWVRTVDPTRGHEMRKVLEYEFGSGVHRRLFYGDPNKRGAYGQPRPTRPIEDGALLWLENLQMTWGEKDTVWYDPFVSPIEPEVELTDYILLEDGSKILLEDGSGALVSDSGGSTLLENGSRLLLENGDGLGLE